jgi:hypothetical protein
MGFNQQEHDMGLPENWGIHFKWQMFIGKMMMNGILGHYIFRETMTNLLLYIIYILFLVRVTSPKSKTNGRDIG